MKIGRITLSDRASGGVYADSSGPEIERVVGSLFQEKCEWVRALLPDDREQIEKTLVRFADEELCQLIFTTGGTGPSARDVTPEATRAVLEKELPGFGEIMRIHNFAKVRTAILSRSTAGVRGTSLIINLPGRPSSIEECIPLLAEAIIEGIDHITGVRPRARGR